MTIKACTFRQARSQDLEKGGLFWKSEKSANDLDPNFHCSWISFTRFVRKFRRNFSESSEIRRFFPPKIRWSPKKKKVFAEIETDFSAKFGNSNVWGGLFSYGGGSGGSRKFWWGGIWSTKPQKFGCLHQNWEWFFGRNRKFKRFFRPKSGGLQKKKKGLHQNWDWFFAGFVTFRSVGGDASRNGAELFETEADFSAKIVTFRLVGGDASPHPPPKSATGGGGAIFNFSQKIGLKSIKNVRFCKLHKPMGGLEPPRPPGYATAFRGVLGGALCHAFPPFGPRHKAKSGKSSLKSRNQILMWKRLALPGILASF